MTAGRAAIPVLVLLLVALSAATQAQVIIRPEKEGRPEIWRNASDADTQKAEEAALKDAAERLVEAVYILPVSGDRDVMDMMMKNAQVDKDLIVSLSKAPQTGVGEYLEDGTVRVKVVTTPAEVVKILKQAYAKVDWDLAEEDAVINAVATQTKRTKKIIATGAGALPGSPGERRIPVRRAALLKAKREMAVKVLKMVIRDDDWHERNRRYLREFAQAFKQVPRKMALGLATTRIPAETWADDGSVEMRVELDVVKVSELVRRAQLLYDKRRHWGRWGIPSLVTWTKDMIFKEDPKAARGEPVPKSGILALEFQAVEEAMRITPAEMKTK